MAQNTGAITVEDYDREKSSTQINMGPITAVNFTAKMDALDDLKVALTGVNSIIMGEIRKTGVQIQFTESTDPVTSQQAQRETKWLVTYRDVTQFLDVANTINNVGFGNLYDIELPTAKLSLLADNSDELDLTVTGAAAFVTAFEAVQNSPTGGDEIEVVRIKHVGRST